MKLLLDENLSRRLVPFLQNDYPDSTQVTFIDLETASDLDIWKYAQKNAFVIVTRDVDFYELSLHYQINAPKVVWLRISNTSKNDVLKLLLNNKKFIEEQLLNKGKLCVQIY